MKIDDVKRGKLVALNIPAASPVKTMDGNIHENFITYLVLGLYGGTMVRLSRMGDNAKLIIEADRICLWPETVKTEPYVSPSVKLLTALHADMVLRGYALPALEVFVRLGLVANGEEAK